MSAEQRHEKPTRGKGFSRMARQRRRQYGSGCLLKRGRGWAIRWRELEIAPDGTVQKRLRYEALGDVTRSQAAEMLADRLAASDHGKTPTRSRVAFRTLVAEWQANVVPMYKHSTQKNHRHIVKKHLVPRFGGGLGHMAIQLLRVLAPVRIIAADVDDRKLEQAKALGADHIVNNRTAAEAAKKILQITGPRGAGLVLDCVGVQPTVDLGAKLLGRNSVWTIVGLGGGHHDFRHGSTPYGTSMSIPYWGSRVELMEVIAMARAGRIRAETTEFPLTDAVDVYAKLKAGQITGRAVLIPR